MQVFSKEELENIVSAGVIAKTPEGIADLVRPIITGKVVCDIGCAEGYFMPHLAKYAAKVIGVEILPDRAAMAVELGYSVICGDILKVPIPEADIYYSWTGGTGKEITRVYDRLSQVGGIKLYGSHLGLSDHPMIVQHIENLGGISICTDFVTVIGKMRPWELSIIDDRNNTKNVTA